MVNIEGNLRKEDYTGWVVQGFLRNPTDLEIFLVPSIPGSELSARAAHSARSIRLHGVQAMEIWDFGKRNYDSLRYFIAVPTGENALLLFSSSGGCHAQVFCSTATESVFKEKGRWMAEYVHARSENGRLEMIDHAGIHEDWHDYDVEGFIRYEDRLEMLLAYPQRHIDVEGDFPLAGRITFQGELQSNLSNFQPQNVLSYADAKPKGADTLVDFDSSVGCNGLMTCRKIVEASCDVKGDWRIVFRPEE